MNSGWNLPKQISGNTLWKVTEEKLLLSKDAFAGFSSFPCYYWDISNKYLRFRASALIWDWVCLCWGSARLETTSGVREPKKQLAHTLIHIRGVTCHFLSRVLLLRALNCPGLLKKPKQTPKIIRQTGKWVILISCRVLTEVLNKKKNEMQVEKSWFENKRTADRFKIATQRPCGLPAWKHERRSHSIKWKMLLLTSDTSPPTSCLRPSFMRGCKNVDWLQQAGSLYPSYHKIESRWKTQVRVVLEVSFFF